MTNYDEILKLLDDALKEIEKLTDFENLSKENSKKSQLLGKNVDKYVSKLISNNDGIEKYKTWLFTNDVSLKWNAALNLYPIFPKMCLNALAECEIECYDTLKKSSMNAVIEAYKKSKNNNNIFIKRLQKLYKINNLSVLNRE